MNDIDLDFATEFEVKKGRIAALSSADADRLQLQHISPRLSTVNSAYVSIELDGENPILTMRPGQMQEIIHNIMTAANPLPENFAGIVGDLKAYVAIRDQHMKEELKDMNPGRGTAGHTMLHDFQAAHADDIATLDRAEAAIKENQGNEQQMRKALDDIVARAQFDSMRCKLECESVQSVHEKTHQRHINMRVGKDDTSYAVIDLGSAIFQADTKPGGMKKIVHTIATAVYPELGNIAGVVDDLKDYVAARDKVATEIFKNTQPEPGTAMHKMLQGLLIAHHEDALVLGKAATAIRMNRADDKQTHAELNKIVGAAQQLR